VISFHINFRVIFPHIDNRTIGLSILAAKSETGGIDQLVIYQ